MTQSGILSDLLLWLEGKGFDRASCLVEVQESPEAGGGRKLVAKRDIYAQQPLVAIPRAALFNRTTIAPLYPVELVESLTGNQLLCLHLCLYRRASLERAADLQGVVGEASPAKQSQETFAPFIASLPREFGTVPLWSEVCGERDIWQHIRDANLLPEGLKTKAADVKRRFDRDWHATTGAWARYQPPRLHKLQDMPSLTEQDFVWAWLNVNSRCIWYDLKLKRREDNFTMAPIIDMANHAPGRKESVMDEKRSLTLYSSDTARTVDSYDQLLPKTQLTTKQGEEVVFSYGAHGDDTLLTEYGFCIGAPANTDHTVEVSERVRKLLFEVCGDTEGQRKQQILSDADYWGDYHITLDPDGRASVSYRLTVALSLLHLRGGGASSHDKNSEDDGWLRPFFSLVEGRCDRISQDNERKVQQTVERICADIVSDGEDAVKCIAEERERTQNTGNFGALDKAENNGASDDALAGMVSRVWESDMWCARRLLGNKSV